MLRPDGLLPSRSFSLVVSPKWHRVEAGIILGPFAGPLLAEMRKLADSRKAVVDQLQTVAAERGWKTKIEVEDVDPPSERVVHVVQAKLVDMDQATKWAHCVEAAEIALSIGLAIMPLEEEENVDTDTGAIGLPEGAVTRVLVNRYERNPVNRAICLTYYGSRCQACGVELSERYGALAKGFIHVHHRTPVSTLGPDYVIDPILDLIPLCPNCHAVIHLSNPPLQPEALRTMIAAIARPESVS